VSIRICSNQYLIEAAARCDRPLLILLRRAAYKQFQRQANKEAAEGNLCLQTIASPHSKAKPLPVKYDVIAFGPAAITFVADEKDASGDGEPSADKLNPMLRLDEAGVAIGMGSADGREELSPMLVGIDEVPNTDMEQWVGALLQQVRGEITA